MISIELGTKRWVEYPLADGSGTPDDVEAVVVTPAGTQTATACTLLSGYYGVLVTFNTAGTWTVIHNAFKDDDATNPYDSRTLRFSVAASKSATPFERA